MNHRRALEEVMDGVCLLGEDHEVEEEEGAEEGVLQLNTPEMTEEVKRELEIITMRDYLDTKSFFKVRALHPCNGIGKSYQEDTSQGIRGLL